MVMIQRYQGRHEGDRGAKTERDREGYSAMMMKQKDIEDVMEEADRHWQRETERDTMP